jgi:hypothetical protein
MDEKEVMVENPSAKEKGLKIDVISNDPKVEAPEEETKTEVEETPVEEKVETPVETEAEVVKETVEETPKTDVEPKTFTQQELDDIIVSRLAKERQRYLKKLGLEDEAQLDTYANKVKTYDEIEKENQALKTEKQKMEATAVLNNLGVDPDFIDFVYTNVEKGENFEENAKKYLEQHPKMKRETYQSVNSSLGLSGGNMPDINKMSTEEYLKWRANNKL